MRIVLHKTPVLMVLTLLWLTYLGFSVLDGTGVLQLADIGLLQTLETSKAARSMAVDVLLLSIMASLWVVWDGYNSQIGKTIALPFAVLTLLVGSAGLLLYLIVRVWLWRENTKVLEGSFRQSWGPFKVSKYK